MIGMGRYSKPVGESTKCYPTWQEVFLEGPRLSVTGRWAHLVDAHRHIQKTVLPVIKCYGSAGWVKSRNELMNSFCMMNEWWQEEKTAHAAPLVLSKTLF